MFNRQQKSVATSSVQGSSSSSTVKRTFVTSSTTLHSESSTTFFQTSTDPKIHETISRFEQLSIKQPSNVITSRKVENFTSPESETVSATKALTSHKVEVIQPKLQFVNSKPANNYAGQIGNFVSPKSEPIPQSIDQFRAECLKAHNEYRRKHGVGPLKLDSTISNFAQNWANTIASRRQLEHSSDRKYGENIYWSSGKSITGKAPVDSWYDEIKQYSYKNASFSSGTGHFTQVVWKSSCDLGVGMACVGNEVYVVASYYPVGNVYGEFSKNVLPPK